MRGIDGFFRGPVAVIGASSDASKPGHVILENFLKDSEEGLFKGDFFAINIKGREIECLDRKNVSHKIPCYKSVADVPYDINMAVISVPSPAVNGVLTECGEKGIKYVVVPSAGFREAGEEGKALERESLEIIKKYGMRMIGHNCLGIIDTYNGINTIFLPEEKQLSTGERLSSFMIPKRGHMSVISQSGSFGLWLAKEMHNEKLGINKAVFYGNMADVNQTDILKYYGGDDNTDVIMSYFESIDDDGIGFMDAAVEVSRCKPVIAMKAGKGQGALAAKSHTAAVSTSDDLYDAAFRMSGIIRADTSEELFAMSKALAYQPPARGDRILVLTDAGGIAILAVDKFEDYMLRIPERAKTRTMKGFMDEMKRSGKIPPLSVYENTIDLTGSVRDGMYGNVLEEAFKGDDYDGVIFVAFHEPPGLTERFAGQVIEAARKYDKPLVAVNSEGSGFGDMMKYKFEMNGIPTCRKPESATYMMNGLVRYGEILMSYDGSGGKTFEQYIKKFKEKRPSRLRELQELITVYRREEHERNDREYEILNKFLGVG